VSSEIKVAFLGLGSMGHRMATRLLAAGDPLSVWNRTASRGDDLVARGAVKALTPADAARGANAIIFMLADPGAVDRVLFAEDGVLGAAERGATIIDCSTVGPEDSRAFAASCAAAGIRYVEAPVLGSLGQAESGQLVALAAGDDALVSAAEPILQVLAKQVVRAGATGQGSALKLVMNLLVGGITELLAESTLLGERAGLRKEVLRETLLGSVLGSPFVAYKAPQLLDRKFAPLFSAKLLLKDLDLILHLARDVGAPLPATKVIRDVYGRAVAAGHGDDDIAVVIEQVSAEPAPTGA
jgi:3-hydroxyisobutyrate dehydrogenase-like beta-hydroxyacid dehydrogenase